MQYKWEVKEHSLSVYSHWAGVQRVEGRHLNHKEVQMFFWLAATQYVGP